MGRWMKKDDPNDETRFYRATGWRNKDNLIQIAHYADEVFIPCRPFKNYNTEGYYVSNYGRVYSPYGYILTPIPARHGYLRVNINQLAVSIHRLVLYSFDPNPNYENLQINHKNGIKTDNRLINLEWCTAQENIQHAVQNGLSFGENYHKSKHTEEDAKKVCEAIEKGNMTIQEMSDYLNLSRQFIEDVKYKKTWKSVSQNYNI